MKIKEKLQSLVESGKQAFELLIEEVKRPIDPDLPDDKSRNAMKAKKECFMDAKDILLEVQKIEAHLNGEIIEDVEKVSDNPYKGGHAEQFAKQKK